MTSEARRTIGVMAVMLAATIVGGLLAVAARHVRAPALTPRDPEARLVLECRHMRRSECEALAQRVRSALPTTLLDEANP